MSWRGWREEEEEEELGNGINAVLTHEILKEQIKKRNSLHGEPKWTQREV